MASPREQLPLAAPPIGTQSCRDFVLATSDFLDGRLPLMPRARVAAHLLVCAPCARYLASARELDELVRSSFRDPSPGPMEFGGPARC